MQPENQKPIGGGRVPLRLHLWLDNASQWLPKLENLKSEWWRPLVVGVFALQMGACKPPSGSENQTSSPPAITEIYQSPSQTPELIPTSELIPTTTLTEIPTLTPTLTSTPEPTATPTPESTETPTHVPPEPTATPTPTSGIERQIDGSFVVITEKGERLTVPQIAGLRQEVEDINGVEIVVYKAEKGNSYGLKENAYAGEFRPNVMVEEKTTGGLVLTAPVVLDELNKQLSQIPEQKDRWLIPLPVDIRGIDPRNPIRLEFKKGYGDYQIPIVEIQYSGEAAVVNVIPSSDQILVAKNTYYGWICIDSFRLIDPHTDRIPPGKEMHYITVAGKFEDFSENTTIRSRFGHRISFGQGPFNVSLGAAREWFAVTPDKMLSLGGIPVFVAANSS